MKHLVFVERQIGKSIMGVCCVVKKVVSVLFIIIFVISAWWLADGRLSLSNAESITIYWGEKEYRVQPDDSAYQSIVDITKDTLKSDLDQCKCESNSASNLIKSEFDSKALAIRWVEAFDTKQIVFGLEQKDNMVAIGDEPLLSQYRIEAEHIEKLRAIIVNYIQD